MYLTNPSLSSHEPPDGVGKLRRDVPKDPRGKEGSAFPVPRLLLVTVSFAVINPGTLFPDRLEAERHEQAVENPSH